MSEETPVKPEINPAAKIDPKTSVAKLTVMMADGMKLVFPIEPESIESLKSKVVRVSPASKSRTLQHSALVALNRKLLLDPKLLVTGIWGDYTDQYGQPRRFALAGHSVRD
jgi:hypothetical protein